MTSSLAELTQCVAMMRSRPATDSAVPATILLAALIFNLGISAAMNQIPANKINKNPTSASVMLV